MNIDDMSTDELYTAAIGDGHDPAGTPWPDISPERLRGERTSIKWTRFREDVLPLFVAEMDFAVASEVQDAIVERVRLSDTGYLDGPGALAPAFARFADERWGWRIDESFVHLATDVSCGVVEPLRLVVSAGGRVAVTTPVYPGFFEMLSELPVEVVEVPLSATTSSGAVPPAARFTEVLDFAALEREFAAGLDALVLSNPHNPHGRLHTPDELARLARLAAKHDVFVISDEIHAPLTHHGQPFTPFAPIAATAGALSVTATSASKGWNLAGVKCSVIVAADARAHALLSRLPEEVTTRASILGLHANIAAFSAADAWLDRTITQVQWNFALLDALLAERVPGARIADAQAGYLAWLDLREVGLGENPAQRILTDAHVALNTGSAFGAGGAGHARMNLACAPDTIVRAVDRIAALV